MCCILVWNWIWLGGFDLFLSPESKVTYFGRNWLQLLQAVNKKEFLSTDAIACPNGKYLPESVDNFRSLQCAPKVKLLDTKYDLASLNNLVSAVWENKD